jgi:hypothetical protein
MMSHKINEPKMIEMINVMHRAKLRHVKVMNVLMECWGFRKLEHQ